MNRARFVRSLEAQPRRASGRSGSITTGSTLATLLLLLTATSCSESGGSFDSLGGSFDASSEPYATGTELAVVELARPAGESFLLRATLPIKPFLYPRHDNKAPLSIQAPDGTIIKAQNEVVTWYPKQTKGADVVEVIARVPIPAESMTAERLVYSVIWDPHESQRLLVADSVDELLASAQPLLLQSRDVFGHGYTSDLLAPLNFTANDIPTTRAGKYIHQFKLHDWMMADTPVEGSTGTLPHLMGLHGFVALYDREQFFSLDLRVHNGGSGLDPNDPRDDPLGEIFFQDLRLRLPLGWKMMSAVEDAFQGPAALVGTAHTSYPLVRRLQANKLHMMPIQAQFQRRLVIYKDDPEVEQRARAVLREEGLAFVKQATSTGPQAELFSWWNQQTARYFPQNQRLPDLGFLGEQTLRNQLTNSLAAMENTLESGGIGPWPIVNEAMGWCHPWGPSIGYLHGGTEIHLLDGLRTVASGSREGYLMHQRLQRMYTCRQPDTLYNADGRETRVEDWLQVDGQGDKYLPVWLFLTPVVWLSDTFGFLDAPAFQQEAVAAMGLEPDYVALMREYEPIDIEHLVRYTRSLKVLAWVGNDALAKSDLCMQAELMRLSYNRYPQSPSGQAIVTGMYNDSEFVHEHPGEGFDVNRGEGWAIDTVAAAYAMADHEWRAEVYPWFRTLVNLFYGGQEACSGVVGSVPNWSWFDSQYRLRQSISAAILENAMWSTMSTVFAGQDPEYRDRARRVLKESAYAMISPNYWNDEAHAPYFLAATGPFNVEQPGFCGPPPVGAVEGADSFQTWASFAIGYRLTGDVAFLNRATEMAGGDLRNALTQPGLGELENRAALLVLLQDQRGF